MRNWFAGTGFAMALVVLGSPVAKATITVEFYYPATETTSTFGGSVTTTTEVTGEILELSASGTSSASGVILTNEQADDPNLNYSVYFNSFTITDGAVTAAAYYAELPLGMGSFELSLNASGLDKVNFATDDTLSFSSTSAPTFLTFEPIAEPPLAGVFVLGLFALISLRGRPAVRQMLRTCRAGFRGSQIG